MKAVVEAMSLYKQDIFISASSLLQRNCSISLSTELTLVFQGVRCTKRNTKDKRRMIFVLAT